MDGVRTEGKWRNAMEKPARHRGRTGFLEKVSVPPGKEQTYLDMPVEAGAGAGAGSLAQPPRPMAIAAIAMRAMYFIV